MSELILKSIDISREDVKPSGEFQGYGSVFGVLDLAGDIVMKGAFADSLAGYKSSGRMPQMLASHGEQGMWPIGVWQDVSEDSRGLLMKGKLAMGTSAGREAHELLSMGALTGLSIGFNLPRDGYEYVQKDGRHVRQINKADLWEVSLVAFPANPEARVTSVSKSRRDLEHVLKSLGISERTAKKMASYLPGDNEDADAEIVERFKSSVNTLLAI